MNKDEFQREVLQRLSAIVGALGDIADAIKAAAPPASKPPSSRRGKQ